MVIAEISSLCEPELNGRMRSCPLNPSLYLIILVTKVAVLADGK